MAGTATINWIETGSGKNVDGSTLPAGAGTQLISRFHLSPPSQYVVERLVPKQFWRFWGADTVETTRVDAVVDADVASLGGRYRSEPIWKLPVPDNESGVARFRAKTDTADAYSGVVTSARLWLEELVTTGTASAELSAGVPAAGLTIGPKFGGSRNFEQRWRVRVADDPWVEISILQGQAVLTHLRNLENGLARELGLDTPESMSDLPPDTLTYFVDQPLSETSLTWLLEPTESFTVDLNIQDRPDLKAAICLRVRALDEEYLATSPPRFITHVRDRLIGTDMTIEMLRHEPRDLLFRLSEAGFDVPRLADELGWSRSETWQRLTEAAAELGAPSVSDAAALAATSAPALA